MMKFTMNAKDLKTMMDKGMAAINKKNGGENCPYYEEDTRE